MSLNLTLRDSDAGSYEVRQVVFGMSPMVYITPEMGEEGEEDNLPLNLDSTDLDMEGLIELFEYLLLLLREGVVEEKELE